MRNIGNTKEGTIRCGDSDGLILVSTTANFRGLFHWNSSITGRRGRTDFTTRGAALKSAIKAMGITVDEWVEQ